jgi:molybdopterin/thiamine biosynthesis adenylyltransferase
MRTSRTPFVRGPLKTAQMQGSRKPGTSAYTEVREDRGCSGERSRWAVFRGPLNKTQIDRYTHHIILKDIGGEGQRKLLSSKVLVVGAGGLGSPAALYLAAAGVGAIGVVDDDSVEIGNLQRQILHSTDDIGRKKVASAQEKLCALNTDVRVIPFHTRLSAENIEATISDFDFVVDATDNFETKFLINDTCVRLGKPFSHAGVVGFKGQTFTYIPGSLCYRCIFSEPPPFGTIQNCRGHGVVGAVAGVLGSVQAAEAIKFLIGKGELLTDRLMTIDLLSMDIRTIPLTRRENCPACSRIK